jgi:hypothetical protein
MTAIVRRSHILPISIGAAAQDPGDLDGVQDQTNSFDVTGALRVIIVQGTVADDTAGTAGIDVVQVSHDGGINWAADTTVLPLAENDNTGTVQASGALNAAGVEPASSAAGIFKCGPYEGPTAIRVVRDTDGFGGTDWVTGAPGVTVIAIGGDHSGGALTALA